MRVIRACPTKSCSLDPVPTKLVKSCVEVTAPLFHGIINGVLETCEVPGELKRAVVTPIIKSDKLPPEFPSFRPISNLPFMEKVMEKIVFSRLSAHLEGHGLLDELQSAYRLAHSTETAILRVFSDIMNAMDKGQGTVLVLLDLSAAFDTIDHEILCNRLKEWCGIEGSCLEFFKSYLRGRLQAVEIAGQRSEWQELTCGVPQGSVLGPLLFVIYILPLGCIIKNSANNYHLFADDSSLYKHFLMCDPTILSRVVQQLNELLCTVNNWMTNNKLKFNAGKTEYMVITSPYYKKTH